MYRIEYAYVTEDFDRIADIVGFDTDDCDQAYELFDRWFTAEIESGRLPPMIADTLRLRGAN